MKKSRRSIVIFILFISDVLACFQTIEPCAPENSCKFETWLGIQNKKMTGESPEVRSNKRKPREKKKEKREKKRERERKGEKRERKERKREKL